MTKLVHVVVRFHSWQLTIKFITMSKIKFTYNKVYNYVKGKSVVDLIFETIAFGVLLPIALTGIVFMFYQVIFNGVTIWRR